MKSEAYQNLEVLKMMMMMMNQEEGKASLTAEAAER